MVDIVTRAGKGSPLTNNEVDANFTNLAEVSGVTGEPMGHEDRTTSTISFNASTRTFTIAPVSGSFTVWCKGKKVVVSSAQTVTIPNTSGMHSIYYDANGTLSSKIGYFTFSTEAPTAYVYWNATTGAAPYFGDERHGVVLDWQTHEYLHRTRGAAIANGFLASGYTLNNSSTNAATQIAIESGTFFDEDMKIDIVSTATPTAGTYQQNLLFPAKIPVLHLQGTSWVMDAPTDFPFKQGTSRPQYNSVSGGVWSTADVGNNQHATTWILATNNLTYPVIAIIGQSATDNLGEAEAFSFADLTLTGFPSVEFRPLYKLIYKASDGYANSVNAQLVSIVDLRSISAVGSVANPATDHGNLSGLSDDDHPQYLSVDTVRGTLTAAVKASFLPSQAGNAGKFLTTDATSTSWASLTSGNITTALGFTPYNATNPAGYITGITSSNVTTALGFTPYNATNPSGYVTAAGARGAISVTGAGSYDSATGVINIVGGVTSFNTRTGAITLSSADVTTALGFTPYNSTNPNGYLTGITSTQVTTALGYTPYNSSNPSGYITGITSGMVTTALGFTPYNNSNPSGYITSSALSGYLTSASAASTYLPLAGGTTTGTTTLVSNFRFSTGGETGSSVADFRVNTSSRNLVISAPDTGAIFLNFDHGSGGVNFANGAAVVVGSVSSAGAANFVGAITQNGSQVLHAGNYSSYALALTGGSLSGPLVVGDTTTASITDQTNYSNPLAIQRSSNAGKSAVVLRGSDSIGTAIEFGRSDAASHWGTYLEFLVHDNNTSQATTGLSRKLRVDATTVNSLVALQQSGNQVLHAGNYTSYSPTLTGGGASGTWGISISGNAATATSATDSTKLPLSGGTVTGATKFTGNLGNSPAASPPGVWVGISAGNDGQIQLTGASPHIDFANADEDFDIRIIREGDDTLGIRGGWLGVDSSVRSPLFYDSDDTGFYTDPAGVTNIKHLRVNGNWGDYGEPWNAQITIRGGYPSMQFRSSTTGSVWLRHMDGAGDIQHYYGSAGIDTNSWSIRHTMTPGGTFSSIADHRAPVFYDSNDTAYYGDFNNTSVFSKLWLNGKQGINGGVPPNSGTSTPAILRMYPGYPTYGEVLDFGMNIGPTYAWIQATNYAGLGTNYPLLLNPNGGNVGIGLLAVPAAKLHVSQSTPTGIGGVPGGVTMLSDSSTNNYLLFRNTADNGTYGGIAFQDNNIGGYVVFGNAGGGGDQLYVAGYGGGQLQQGYSDSINPGARTTIASWNPTGLQVNSGDMRASIYYDIDDTSYYVNPNSETRLVYASVNVGNESTGGANSSNQGLILRGNYNSNTWAHKFHKFDTGTGVVLYLSQTVGASAWGALQSWGNGLTYTSQVFGSFRANDTYGTIFYDADNTGYFCNPNGTSNFLALSISSGQKITLQDDNHYLRYVSGGFSGATIDGPQLGGHQGGELVTNMGGNNWSLRWNSGGDTFSRASSRAPIFYDSNDTAYYCDPNGVSRLYVVRANGLQFGGSDAYLFDTGLWAGTGGYPGYQFTGGSSRFGFSSTSGAIDVYTDGNFYGGAEYYGANRLVPLFDQNQGGGALYSSIVYDTNNTGFYLDPNNASNISDLVVRAGTSVSSITSLTTGTAPIRVSNTGTGTGDVRYIPMISGTSTSSSGYLQHTVFGSVRGTVWGSAFIAVGGNDSYPTNAYTFHYEGYGTAPSSWRAPIFYDSNDTGYYIDPNSSGVSLRIAGAIQSNHTSWTGEMNKIQWHGSSLYFQNMNDGFFIFRNSNGAEPFTLNANGAGTASASWRSPIFYDSNDTGYYIDPNGTSRIGGIQISPADAGGTGNGIRFYGNSGDGAGNYDHAAIIDRLWGSADQSELLIFKGNDPDTSTIHDRVRIAATGRIVFHSVNGYTAVDAYISGNTGNINGSGYFNGNDLIVTGNVTAYSDLRLKEDVQVIQNALSKLKQLDGVTYTRNDLDDKTRRYAGVIAQQVELVLPEVVEQDEDGLKNVAYGNMVSLLVEAIKEQNQEVVDLRNRVAQLESLIHKLIGD